MNTRLLNNFAEMELRYNKLIDALQKSKEEEIKEVEKATQVDEWKVAKTLIDDFAKNEYVHGEFIRKFGGLWTREDGDDDLSIKFSNLVKQLNEMKLLSSDGKTQVSWDSLSPYTLLGLLKNGFDVTIAKREATASKKTNSIELRYQTDMARLTFEYSMMVLLMDMVDGGKKNVQ
jgi:hypothetical protein